MSDPIREALEEYRRLFDRNATLCDCPLCQKARAALALLDRAEVWWATVERGHDTSLDRHRDLAEDEARVWGRTDVTFAPRLVVPLPEEDK